MLTDQTLVILSFLILTEFKYQFAEFFATLKSTLSLLNEN